MLYGAAYNGSIHVAWQQVMYNALKCSHVSDLLRIPLSKPETLVFGHLNSLEVQMCMRMCYLSVCVRPLKKQTN